MLETFLSMTIGVCSTCEAPLILLSRPGGLYMALVFNICAEDYRRALSSILLFPESCFLFCTTLYYFYVDFDVC